MQTDDAADDLAHEIVGLERELMQPETRSSETRLRQLLHVDFLEIGASGKVWDLDGILAMLDGEQRAGRAAPSRPTEFEVRLLSPTLVQLMYQTQTGSAKAIRRSSLWSAVGEGWRMIYHQGTPTE